MIPLFCKSFEYCLKVFGIWPYGFNAIGPLVLFSFLSTTLPFQCWNAFNLTENLLILMDNLSDVFVEILIMIKIVILWNKKSDIRYLLREIADDWSRKELPVEWKTLALYARIICNVDVIIYIGTVILYYPEVVLSYIGNPIEERNLLFKTYYPFNFRSTPLYEILNIFYLFQGILGAIADVFSKSLLVTLILHVSAQIYILESQIEEYSLKCINLHDISSKRNFDSLKILVRQHLKILDLVQRIDAIYSYVSLSQLIFSNVIICVTGFVIITAMEAANMMLMFKFIMFIIAMFGQAFYFCFAGQYLCNRGESIVYTINNSYWYNSESKQIKVLMFLLSNAQKSLTLSGGKLFQLSANSFMMIVKTSASYLSVLRAMYT